MTTNRGLEIDGRRIDDSSDCYVIAEIGHNHQGSVDKAKEMFDVAKRCGADAVKLQKRHNRSLFTKDYYFRPYDNDNSFGDTYGEHREALEFGRGEYTELKAHAEQIGITFFATAFDKPSCEFLADLDMPAYKIASADIKNTPLLKTVAETGKPVILSTGGAHLDDVLRAYSTVVELNPNVAVLQCTAAYPADFEDLDLRVIETFREVFPDKVIGLSSHDNGISMAVAAYVLGARIIEKHFTLNRAMRGSDHAFSLEPQGLEKMVRDLQRTRVALGDGTKSVRTIESQPVIKMAKKLVAARDLPAGTTITYEDVAAKSPGDGLPPYEIDRLVGCTLRQPLPEDMAFNFEMLEESLEQIAADNGAQVGDAK